MAEVLGDLENSRRFDEREKAANAACLLYGRERALGEDGVCLMHEAQGLGDGVECIGNYLPPRN